VTILFVALTSPYPPTNGHRLKTWSLLQALARDRHSVTLLVLTVPGEEVEDASPLRKLCEHVDFISTRHDTGLLGHKYVQRLANVLSPLPYNATRFRCPHLKKRIHEAIASAQFDVILCDGAYVMQNLPEQTQTPVLLNKDDVAYLLAERYSKLEKNPIKKFYARVEARKLRRFEQDIVNRATVLSCSELDRAQLQLLCPAARIAVIPNVVDTNHYTPAGEGEKLSVLYQGGMDWYPNRDAVEFFISAILPRLRTLAPGLRFVVAGRDPRGNVGRRFAHLDDVRFTGAVPDMREQIARAAVCVVPLRIGSGTRLKILEAAAMAKPIVSTRVGAEGLNFIDGEEILLVDEPRAFAQAIAELLANQSYAQSLGQAARRRVEKNYGLPVLSAALRHVLATSGPARSTDHRQRERNEQVV